MHDTTVPVIAPKPKKKRVFMWTFLAIQVIFLIWVITGIASGHGTGSSAHQQALQYCAGDGWQGLFKSYSDCVTHYGNGLNTAGEAGTAIGVGLIVVLWVVVDVILGIGRFVVLFARRGK